MSTFPLASDRPAVLRVFLARHGIWIAGLVILAACVGWIVTQNGLNYGYDGGYYLSYAESIRAGHGLSLRITSFGSNKLTAWIDAWPPLYPMILALGSDVFAWARLLDVLMLMAAVALTYAIGYRVIGQSWAAAAAALVFLTIPTVLSQVYSTPLSETVFTVLSLAIVLLMMNYRFGSSRPSMRPALYASALAAFTLLTRYLGLTVVLAMILYGFLWALSVRDRRRWRPVLWFVLSIIPLGIYCLYLYGMTGSFTGVQQTDQPLKISHILESLRQMSLQLLHGGTYLGGLFGINTNWVVAGIAVLLLVGLAWVGWRSRARLRAALNSGDALLVTYVAVYVVGFWMLGARSHWIVADWRHYVPIYPALLVLVFHMLTVLPINRLLISTVIALYCVSGIAAIPATLKGILWNTEAWRTDPIVAQLPSLIPSDALIHSNEVGYLALHLGVDTTIRVFGGSFGFREYQCSDLVYPSGFSTTVFTLFDSDLLRDMTPDDARVFFTNWASPCGTVESIVNDPFALVMLVHLNGR